MNMSYCRFNNTNLALDECLNVLEEPDGETISQVEKVEAKKMFRRFLDFCYEKDIIEDYNIDMIDTLFKSFKE